MIIIENYVFNSYESMNKKVTPMLDNPSHHQQEVEVLKFIKTVLALGSSWICGLWMYLFQFSWTKSPSTVTHIVLTLEKVGFWICDIASENTSLKLYHQTDAFSSFSCFTSYKLLLTSQEKNKWPQMLFSKNFNTVHMIQAHTEEYLVTRNYWHPRLDFIMRNTNTVWILCLCPVFLLHCNLFENRISGIVKYAQSLKKYLKSSKGLWSIYFDERKPIILIKDNSKRFSHYFQSQICPNLLPVVKNSLANAGDKRCRFDPWIGKIPQEKGMANHSSILAWKIPGTEEPGGLQSIGSQRVGHDWSDLACTHVY